MGLDINEVYNMNCLEGMELIKPETIDLLLTDPHCNGYKLLGG